MRNAEIHALSPQNAGALGKSVYYSKRHEQGNDWNIDVVPEIDLRNGVTVGVNT
jgi:hypothetical protein